MTAPTQRNLSAEGLAEERAAGEGFKRFGPPVARFVSSRYCRVAQTARMFADQIEWSEPLTSEGPVVKSPERIAGVRALLATRPPAGMNHMLFAHQGIFFEATGTHRAGRLGGGTRSRQLPPRDRAHRAGGLGEASRQFADGSLIASGRRAIAIEHCDALNVRRVRKHVHHPGRRERETPGVDQHPRVARERRHVAGNVDDPARPFSGSAP